MDDYDSHDIGQVIDDPDTDITITIEDGETLAFVEWLNGQTCVLYYDVQHGWCFPEPYRTDCATATGMYDY